MKVLDFGDSLLAALEAMVALTTDLCCPATVPVPHLPNDLLVYHYLVLIRSGLA